MFPPPHSIATWHGRGSTRFSKNEAVSAYFVSPFFFELVGVEIRCRIYATLIITDRLDLGCLQRQGLALPGRRLRARVLSVEACVGNQAT